MRTRELVAQLTPVSKHSTHHIVVWLDEESRVPLRPEYALILHSFFKRFILSSRFCIVLVSECFQTNGLYLAIDDLSRIFDPIVILQFKIILKANGVVEVKRAGEVMKVLPR